jgi:hypothetical protein
VEKWRNHGIILSDIEFQNIDFYYSISLQTTA